ncbi:MAG TPA: hypothetical protein VNN19_12265, partial [bacterium]|nr:hypothetical protein [bacterium]
MTAGGGRPGARVALLAVGVALAAALPFTPALDGPFLDWDDRANIVENPHLRALGPAELRWMLTATLLGQWIPLTWLSLALDY